MWVKIGALPLIGRAHLALAFEGRARANRRDLGAHIGASGARGGVTVGQMNFARSRARFGFDTYLFETGPRRGGGGGSCFLVRRVGRIRAREHDCEYTLRRHAGATAGQQERDNLSRIARTASGLVVSYLVVQYINRTV